MATSVILPDGWLKESHVLNVLIFKGMSLHDANQLLSKLRYHKQYRLHSCIIHKGKSYGTHAYGYSPEFVTLLKNKLIAAEERWQKIQAQKKRFKNDQEIVAYVASCKDFGYRPFAPKVTSTGRPLLLVSDGELFTVPRSFLFVPDREDVLDAARWYTTPDALSETTADYYN